MKNKTFYGILGLNISISGVANDVKSLKGESSLVIKNGNLLEFNPLKGLVSFFFIPHFGNIVFTHAQGDFTISDGFITTDNLELLGPELGLIAEGKMSFSGDLDFLVNAQAIQPGQKETAGEQAGIIGKTTEVVAKAGSLTGIKISGTINKPKYKIQPIAENIIKKVGDILSNLVP